jgi:hypothetical protein
MPFPVSGLPVMRQARREIAADLAAQAETELDWLDRIDASTVV